MVCVSSRGARDWGLYDLRTDPGEQHNIADRHPEVVREFESAYDRWWEDSLPCLVNEEAIAPKANPFKELYWKQFGGGPDEKLLQRMSPSAPADEQTDGKAKPKRKKKQQAGQ
jgi:arylsulfatase